MRIRKQLVWSLAVCAALVTGLSVGRAQESQKSGRIVAVFGVGGILADDGILWQYLPDIGWVTMDEAFAREGRETHLLPLPVRPQEVRVMESWGFLVTHAGEAWQYDMIDNRWENIGAP